MTAAISKPPQPNNQRFLSISVSLSGLRSVGACLGKAIHGVDDFLDFGKISSEKRLNGAGNRFLGSLFQSQHVAKRLWIEVYVVGEFADGLSLISGHGIIVQAQRRSQQDK